MLKRVYDLRETTCFGTRQVQPISLIAHKILVGSRQEENARAGFVTTLRIECNFGTICAEADVEIPVDVLVRSELMKAMREQIDSALVSDQVYQSPTPSEAE